ncbi:hypothetical protein CDL12_08146 [Handroanthus impetiginosus]|uniref:Plant bHLH transcription factor ACT-like domain-containing protein n=1 Tax=Handroanthus impetiginosus TaxID=429701 RepID=A0A2G9HNP0_9LAMI|nr:hypothetical protein CDL12_08146 [Handroanthus impetiginosus]
MEDQMINEKSDPIMEENNKSDDSDPYNFDENAHRLAVCDDTKSYSTSKVFNDLDTVYKLFNPRQCQLDNTRLDRAAILEDAINYVKELQKQVKDLQLHLEEHSDDDNSMTVARKGIENSMPLATINQNGTKSGPKRQHECLFSGFHKESSVSGGISTSKHNHQVENMNQKTQQMEPQVEVYQMGGNEIFVKVFCEHKVGGFVRLMEALSSLGLQVINVNVTRHTCLVSNIFRLEKTDCGIVQADHLKEFLLQLARNPYNEGITYIMATGEDHH